MKKFYRSSLAIIICFFIQYSFAQETGSKLNQITAKDTTKTSQSKDIIRTANDLKSGNWQDVLTSFLQLSASDITGKEHQFNFKANLFSLKVKADSSLLIDTNYIKHRFSRNFQFNFSLKTDSNYHFNGFKGGFTWAIVNKRDSSVVQFTIPYYQESNELLSDALSILTDSLTIKERGPHQGEFKSEKDSLFFRKVKDSVDNMLDKGIISETLLPKILKNRNTIIDLFTKADSAFKDSLAQVAKQPLVTISANGNFDKQNSKLNGGDAEFVWLQGFTSKAYKTGKGSSCESDFRIIGNLKDTMIDNSSIRRSILGATWGLNILAIRNSKSIIELKPYLEYKHIFQGTIENEKKDNFYANADLRIRITDNLWIPLTIKYDFKKKNFLGFLNLSFNINAFKTPKS